MENQEHNQQGAQQGAGEGNHDRARQGRRRRRGQRVQRRYDVRSERAIQMDRHRKRVEHRIGMAPNPDRFLDGLIDFAAGPYADYLIAKHDKAKAA